MTCKICDNPASEDYSFKAIWMSTKNEGIPGQCVSCKNIFCDEHLNTIFLDDDVGGFEQILCCDVCMKEAREKTRKNFERNYGWIREKIPVLGGGIYYLLSVCML